MDAEMNEMLLKMGQDIYNEIADATGSTDINVLRVDIAKFVVSVDGKRNDAADMIISKRASHYLSTSQVLYTLNEYLRSIGGKHFVKTF